MKNCQCWNILQILSLLLFLGSCATGVAPPAHVPVREDSAEKKITTLIDNRESEHVLMLIDRYRIRNGWESSWLDTAEATAISHVEEDLVTALAEEDLAAAVGLLATLQTIASVDADSDQLQKDILSLEFSHRKAAEQYPLAIAAFLQLLEYTLPEKPLIQAGISLIVEQHDSYAFETAVERIDEHGGSTEWIVEEYVLDRFSPSRQVPGVATVWVNKGLRIDEGVGRPDRVIGSGFFIDKRGYLVTNYHVIQSEVDPAYRGYSRVYIRPHDAPESRIPARVIGFDPILDLAILKVPYAPDYVFPVSGIRDRDPGSRVFAIGSPGGLSNTITSGIISATGRRFLQLGEAVQVDAPLNPGNSGGPILDEDGDLVGVVYAGVPQFDGITFAVPSYWLRGVLSRLYEEGRVDHAYLGVSVHELHNGLEVTHVIVGSPAEQAGVTVGDVLTHINGVAVTSLEHANRLLLSQLPGSLVQLGLRAQFDGGVREVQQRIQLNERPQRPLEDSLRGTSHFPLELFPSLYGVFLNEIRTGWTRSEYSVQRILSGTIADEAGLSVQDPVTLHKWEYDADDGIVAVYIRVKKRMSGYMDSTMVLPVFIETTNVL